MICQHCQQEHASVQFTEVVGERKRSLWLCSTCANLQGMLVSLPEAPAQREGSQPGPQLRCPRCQSSLRSIRRSGRVGCPDCYEIFASALRPLLQRVHGRTQHGPGLDGREELRLREEIERAVEQEDFERAARLRDRLGQLVRPREPDRP